MIREKIEAKTMEDYIERRKQFNNILPSKESTNETMSNSNPSATNDVERGQGK